MSCTDLILHGSLPRGQSVVAVEEHEEREDQRCQEMGELEPLISHGSVCILVRVLQQDGDRLLLTAVMR